MSKKEFSNELHDSYDQPAKDAFVAYISANYPNSIVIESPFGKYGVDFKITNQEKKVVYLDTEVRPSWVGSTFPYTTIHLPTRKLKFANADTYFLSLNRELTRGLLFKIRKSDTAVEVSNKYVKSGEEFIDIPLSRCTYIDLV